MVRVHATYADDPGLIPAGGLLLLSHFPYFVSVYCLIKVSMPEKILKKKDNQKINENHIFVTSSYS